MFSRTVAHTKSSFKKPMKKPVKKDASKQKTRWCGDSNRELTAAAMAAPPRSRQARKENIRDFISKKREIFLMQMSLDTKRAEMSKLEVRCSSLEETSLFFSL
jgi:hypothetical protein